MKGKTMRRAPVSRVLLSRILLSLAIATPLLVGCGSPAPADPPPVAEAPPTAPAGTPPAAAGDSATVPPNAPGAASSRSTVSPLPSRAPLYPLAAPSFSQGPIGAVPNPGPVTGYGPGGMGHIPGSPPNPPYR